MVLYKIYMYSREPNLLGQGKYFVVVTHVHIYVYVYTHAHTFDSPNQKMLLVGLERPRVLCYWS